MSQELATQNTHGQLTRVMSMDDKLAYATNLAQASLLPRAYQKQPGNVLLAIELGESLGIPPIQAISTVHVIEGKPSASAALISMLVRRAGHTLRVKGDDKQAVAQIVRKDDPDFTYEVVWNLDRAQQAGLLSGKSNWSKYPAAMLKARAITEVARDACQEALMGVQYTPEELGAVVDESGEPVEQPKARPQRMSSHQQEPEQAGGSRLRRASERQAQQGKPAGPERISKAQWEHITGLAAGLKVDAQEVIASVLDGYVPENPWDLTVEQANQVQKALEDAAPVAEAVDAELVDEDVKEPADA